MSTQAATRPVGVDELKRAWQAVNAGDFRTGHRVISKPRGRVTTDELEVWSRATGEHTIAVLGAIGSAGASTVALAAGLAAVSPVRILECCSVSTSGLTAASTAELGLHADRWRQGKRDHVVLERASEILAAVDHVPVPTDAVHENQLTILDVGWEVGQLLGTDCWLADAVRTANQVVVVTTATIPGMRRLAVAMDMLASHWQPEQITLAVRGPRRKKWPRGLEHAGGAATHRALAQDRCVEIPEDRELAVNGLDSRPVPPHLISAARLLLEPAHLSTDNAPT
ncbi:hypothetical protein [Nocardioides jensenii]|uniref:hypothetical protein n=1 Tax=Nocardioides jensenii TaxID=1843 RepID=UPI00082CD882|nr:hypothetical protein [Nocardioides jensenii]